jgi:transposase
MDPEHFVFLDETGATPTMTRRSGWGPKSERLVDVTPWGHWQTTTFVAGLRASGIVAPWVIGGAMDGPAFRTDVEPVLVPEVRQADVVVMDNLPAHKVAGVRDLIRAAGASSLSLPPYSPDLNVLGLDPRIEQLFATIKALLRKAGARTKAAPWNTIGAALQAFRPDECRRDLINTGDEFE